MRNSNVGNARTSERSAKEVRQMNTTKFLHTNLNNYLEGAEHPNDIYESQKVKDKLLQYKYNRAIRSNYGANFANRSAHKKQAIFNLDEERRQLKVPYKPPRTFTTTNGLNLKDS